MSTEGLDTLSVVIVSHDEGEYLRRTVESLVGDLPPDAEIIVVDDASTDGSSEQLDTIDHRVRVFRLQERLGAAASRNFGAQHASGEALLFSDAHVEARTAWARPLLRVLQRPWVGAVGPALTSLLRPGCKGYGLYFTDAGLNIDWLELNGSKPYPVPLLGGFFLVMRREIFDSVGGWDSGLVVWGMEDLELSVRLWTYGYKCLLVPTVDIAHLDRERNSYPDYQLDWETGVHNMLRFAFVHLGNRRLRSVINYYIKEKVFPAALARLMVSDAWQRRQEVRSIRRFNDNWYFRRFNMEI